MFGLLRSPRFWLGIVLTTGAVSLGLLAAPFVSSILTAADDESWTLVAQSRGRYPDFTNADVDGDGVLEDIFLRRTAVIVERRGGRAISQANFQGQLRGTISRVVDLDGNGLAEVVFAQQYPDHVQLVCWWDHGRELEVVFRAYGTDANGDGRIDTGLAFGPIADLDSDGRPEALVIVSPGIDPIAGVGRVRRIMAVRAAPGFPILWERRLGPMPLRPEIVDLDGDGTFEILVSTRAVDNRISAGGMDDTQSYELILDASGEIEVLEPRAGVLSDVQLKVADLDGDDRSELVRIVTTGEDDFPPGSTLIEVVDPITRKILAERSLAFGSAWNVVIAAAEADGREAIYIAQRNQIFRLDADLEIVHREEYPGRIRLNDTGDIDGDGLPELFGFIAENAAAVFDQDLRRILHHEFVETYSRLKFVPADQQFGPTCVASFRHEDGELSWVSNQIEKETNTSGFGSIPVGVWLLAGSWFGAAALAVFWMASGGRRKTAAGLWDAADALPVLIAVVNGRGDLLKVNEHGERWLKSTYPEGTPLHTWLPGVRLERLRSAVAQFLQGEDAEHHETLRVPSAAGESLWDIRLTRSGHGARKRDTVVVLEDRTMEARSRRTMEWASIAQKLVHNRVKNPLGTILLAVRRMEQDLDSRPHDWIERNRTLLKTIASEVSRMDESCRAFLRFTRVREVSMSKVPLYAMMSKLAARLRTGFDPAQHLEVVVDEGLPHLRADPEQLEWMVENLVTNARESLGDGQGSVTLKVYVRDLIGETGGGLGFEHEVVLEVTDTGCGIPLEHRKRMFDPFVTSKPGGSGLGLAIVRQIVDIHSGSIRVESEPELGTRFVVRLPVIPADDSAPDQDGGGRAGQEYESGEPG
jgi:signal transduction histidine kinase